MKNIDHNKSSVACILKIKMKNEDINFLFAGDMEKITIDGLINFYEEYGGDIPCVYNYIKIPHHGSENAGNLIEFLQLDGGKKSEFASTSVFVNKGLPRTGVLKNYEKAVEQIACTSDINANKYGLGIICLNYNLFEKKVKCDFYGTAQYVN